MARDLEGRGQREVERAAEHFKGGVAQHHPGAICKGGDKRVDQRDGRRYQPGVPLAGTKMPGVNKAAEQDQENGAAPGAPAVIAVIPAAVKDVNAREGGIFPETVHVRRRDHIRRRGIVAGAVGTEGLGVGRQVAGGADELGYSWSYPVKSGSCLLRPPLMPALILAKGNAITHLLF